MRSSFFELVARLATVLFCALAMAGGGTAQADPVAPSDWAPPRPIYCAPGSWCPLPFVDAFGKPQVTVLSYGSNDTNKKPTPGWQMHLSSGIKNRKCETVGGRQDLTPTCLVYGFAMPRVTGWIECGQRATLCQIPSLGPNQFKIVRLGSPETQEYVYAYVSSNIACNSSNFSGVNFDPALNKNKPCHYSRETYSSPTSGGWTLCASGGIDAQNNCIFDDDGIHLVRLRKPDDPNYLQSYRLVSGGSFQCWQSNFSSDAYFLQQRDSNQNLYNRARDQMAGTVCEFLRLADIQTVFGGWELVGLCDNCGDGGVEFTVSVGVEKGRSVEKSTSFNQELSVTLRTGNENTPWGTESTITVGFEQSQAITESFNRTESTDFTMSCDKGALYQWVTGVRMFCVPQGGSFSAADCESVARSNMFRCVEPTQSPGTLPVVIDRRAPPR